MRPALLVLFLALTAAPTMAHSQALDPGRKVRITLIPARGQRIIGVVTARDSALLWLRAEPDTAATAFRFEDITRIELATTVEVWDAPALQVLVLGLALAAGAYYGMQDKGCRGGWKRTWCGIGGALVGGYMIGDIGTHLWPTHREERWERLRPPARPGEAWLPTEPP